MPTCMSNEREATLRVQETWCRSACLRNMTPICMYVEQDATLHVKSNSEMWRRVVWEIFTDIHIEDDTSSVIELSVYEEVFSIKINFISNIQQTWYRISTMKPTWCTLHSIYWESKASTGFEHYLLILRRRSTNSIWYIACVFQLAETRASANWHYTQAIYQMPFVLRLQRISK
jgi:hypothetical protein